MNQDLVKKEKIKPNFGRNKKVMKHFTLFNLILGLCVLLPFTACKKVPETTPRYDKDACIICNRFGHQEEAGKCFYCKETTVCQFCKGTGKRSLGTKDKFIVEKCSFCNGSGKCHYCEGTGKCKTCGGTGKYVKPGSGPDSLSAVPEDTNKKLK